MIKYKKTILILLLMVLVLPVVVSAAYTLLEPLPGLAKEGEAVTLSSYLSWLFPFALTFASVMAVVMIAVGGVQLIFGGSEGAKKSAKERINAAIYGLILAFSSWLILNTINPDLVNMKLGIPEVKVRVDNSTVGNGKIGSGASQYQWADVPQNQYCKDVLGTGYVNVNDSFCGNKPTQNSTGIYQCCGLKPVN